MKSMLDKLWSEYFSEECSRIESDEERTAIKHLAELNKSVSESLDREQRESLERYIEEVFAQEGIFIKKAFFKGCEFTLSFLFEFLK